MSEDVYTSLQSALLWSFSGKRSNSRWLPGERDFFFMLLVAAKLKVKFLFFIYTKLKTSNLAREKFMSDLWWNAVFYEIILDSISPVNHKKISSGLYSMQRVNVCSLSTPPVIPCYRIQTSKLMSISVNLLLVKKTIHYSATHTEKSTGRYRARDKERENEPPAGILQPLNSLELFF